jgi:hypothetical protein
MLNFKSLIFNTFYLKYHFHIISKCLQFVLGLFQDCHICFANFPYNLDVQNKIEHHYLFGMLENQIITCNDSTYSLPRNLHWRAIKEEGLFGLLDDDGSKFFFKHLKTTIDIMEIIEILCGGDRQPPAL